MNAMRRGALNRVRSTSIAQVKYSVKMVSDSRHGMMAIIFSRFALSKICSFSEEKKVGASLTANSESRTSGGWFLSGS